MMRAKAGYRVLNPKWLNAEAENAEAINETPVIAVAVSVPAVLFLCLLVGGGVGIAVLLNMKRKTRKLEALGPVCAHVACPTCTKHTLSGTNTQCFQAVDNVHEEQQDEWESSDDEVFCESVGVHSVNPLRRRMRTHV